MFVPMEVIIVTERIDVVECSRLTKIPSEFQAHQDMSKLQKKREEFPYVYLYEISLWYDGF